MARVATTGHTITRSEIRGAGAILIMSALCQTTAGTHPMLLWAKYGNSRSGSCELRDCPTKTTVVRNDMQGDAFQQQNDYITIRAEILSKFPKRCFGHTT